MAQFSIDREIKLTQEDWDKIKVSEPTPLLKSLLKPSENKVKINLDKVLDK